MKTPSRIPKPIVTAHLIEDEPNNIQCAGVGGMGSFLLVAHPTLPKTVFVSLRQATDYLVLCDPEEVIKDERYHLIPERGRKHLHNQKVWHHLLPHEREMLMDDDEVQTYEDSVFANAIYKLCHDHQKVIINDTVYEGVWMEIDDATFLSLGCFIPYIILFDKLNTYDDRVGESDFTYIYNEHPYDETLASLLMELSTAEFDGSKKSTFNYEDVYYEKRAKEIKMRSFGAVTGYWPTTERKDNDEVQFRPPEKMKTILGFINNKHHWNDALPASSKKALHQMKCTGFEEKIRLIKKTFQEKQTIAKVTMEASVLELWFEMLEQKVKITY
jgi:hypothetical protein